MKLHHLKIFLFAAIFLLLVACVSPGGKLQQAGAATAFDMHLDSDLDWSRIKLPRQELWTIDGTALNSLSILSGIKANEHVFMLTKEKKRRPDGPWFRPGMRPDEVRDIILDGLRGQSWSNVSAENLRPQRFGSVDGLRFDITMTSVDGLAYSGTVAAAEKDSKLRLLLWKAPSEHYYRRDIGAVNKMLDGMRFVP